MATGNYLFTVDTCGFVESDHPIQDWQKDMLTEIVNIAYSNQSKAIYGNMSLRTNVDGDNGHMFNILILTTGKVYLLDLTAKTDSEIHYTFSEKWV